MILNTIWNKVITYIELLVNEQKEYGHYILKRLSFFSLSQKDVPYLAERHNEAHLLFNIREISCN